MRTSLARLIIIATLAAIPASPAQAKAKARGAYPSRVALPATGVIARYSSSRARGTGAWFSTAAQLGVRRRLAAYMTRLVHTTTSPHTGDRQ